MRIAVAVRLTLVACAIGFPGCYHFSAQDLDHVEAVNQRGPLKLARVTTSDGRTLILNSVIVSYDTVFGTDSIRPARSRGAEIHVRWRYSTDPRGHTGRQRFAKRHLLALRDIEN